MPSVNQQSLREEFDTLKGEFEKLSSEGKITRESRALFQGMLMLLELVLAVFMEKTTKKNGNNSSLPSSQTDKDETSTGQPGSNSKGPNQNKEPIANSRTIETVEVAEVHCCATCGEDLHQVSPCAQERRTRIDIFFEKVVNHVDAEIKECPVCHAQTKGQFPSYMKALLRETCIKVSKRKNKKLILPEYLLLQRRYQRILAKGEKELPPIPPKQTGKRGKVAKSDAHNLWERLKQHEQAVLLFARESHVSFTNNRAERDLRMNKVKQKVSGCFRSEHYAKAYCRISSYLQTMGNKGYNPLVAIQMALSGQLYAEGGE
jgi:hypothetical protein